MEAVTEICNFTECTGCFACYNACGHSAISMKLDNEGFRRPVIDANVCVGCKKCIGVCPVNSPVNRNEQPMFIYSGWSKDDETRNRSASGGAFTELARFIIEKRNGVVYGVAMDENLEACHIKIDNVDDLLKLQGSKYIQSNVGNTYNDAEELLKQGTIVLFSGTPCQIAGLKNNLRHDYENLFTVDLICHGVPSGRVFKDYIRYLSNQLGHKVYDIKFRCKKTSWIFFNIAVNSHVEKKTGRLTYEYEGAYYSDPFIRAFLRDNILRPSCYQCKYTSTSRVADFTIADWWGYKAENENDKDFEKKGVSLIFCNTNKACEIIPYLQLELRNRTAESAKHTNVSLTHPFAMPESRGEFWVDYNDFGFDKILKKYLKPESLSPTQFVHYKLKQSFIRKTLLLICRKYERFCNIFQIPIIKISA